MARLWGGLLAQYSGYKPAPHTKVRVRGAIKLIWITTKKHRPSHSLERLVYEPSKIGYPTLGIEKIAVAADT